jgi:tetratricopeptide (TPR) repeat protein
MGSIRRVVMFATINSRGAHRAHRRPAPGQKTECFAGVRLWPLILLAGWLGTGLGVLPARAVPPSTDADITQTNRVDFSARAEKLFQEARRRYQADTNNVEAAWQFARACFNYADFATNKTSRADIAKQGINVCRQLIARHPASAPGHYYLGMDLGQVADTKRNLAALRMAKEMEHEVLIVCDLDEKFDYAGSDRNLGLLYLEAPSLISIGSRTKARQRLRRTVELVPDYPENRLVLAEALLKWGETADARRELKALEELWPDARRKFSGDAWAPIWLDWEKRLKNAKDKLRDPSVKVLLPHYGN